MKKTTSHFLALTRAGMLALMAALPAQALTIDTVPVGDPGNPHDVTHNVPGFGSVSEHYNIGKFEITLHQYTEFLNAVADLDSFGLYHPSMATNLNVAGISRTGSSGSYSYAVLGDGQRPVTYVSWFDAARFANWMHNGQPHTGSQTSGTTEQGAYTLNGATAGIITRNAWAQWRIPSEDEWYKAAYYQPNGFGGDQGGYWAYPFRSHAIPNSRNGSLEDPYSANFFRNDGLANGYNGGWAVTDSLIYNAAQNYLTPVGAFPVAITYYGTFDQGGNVSEWNDVVDSSGSGRGVRGGSWLGGENFLRASTGMSEGPTQENEQTGFRLASVTFPRTPYGPFVPTLQIAREGSGGGKRLYWDYPVAAAAAVLFSLESTILFDGWLPFSATITNPSPGQYQAILPPNAEPRRIFRLRVTYQ